MNLFVNPKTETSISAKIIKKDGRIVDLGKVSYDGPWHKVWLWKISRLLKGRKW